MLWAAALFVTAGLSAQNLDTLKLPDKEIPEGYAVVKENNCISIQACTFYNDPGIYEVLVGRLKNKAFQSFESKKEKGSIMYFEFENGFLGEGFLDGLLWGGDKPTAEHPEEYFSKGNFLVIWSFNKGSPVKKISEKRIKAILK